jgi:hypothetical protein
MGSEPEAEMVSAAMKEEILLKLEKLPLQMQRRVLDFADALAQSTPKGVSGKALEPLAGTLDDDSARQMTQAIERYCERVEPVEPRAW